MFTLFACIYIEPGQGRIHHDLHSVGEGQAQDLQERQEGQGHQSGGNHLEDGKYS